ncbi:MAG: PEP-CTERM sorting domain-containing protein [Verrucomicrobiota bacterium]
MAFDRDVYSNYEIAEDLYLAGFNRVLTDLTFHYNADYAQVGGIVVTVYAEGGPDANGLFLPGAKLLEKPVNVQVGSGLANVALAYSAANTVPDRVIVSVRFVDVPAGGSISLVAQPSAPEVGSTRPGYLERTGPGDQDWALRPLADTSGNQVNFLLGVKAAAVPEASTVALGLAGVGILLLAGRRRRP